MNILEGLLQFLLAYVVIGCLLVLVWALGADAKRLANQQKK